MSKFYTASSQAKELCEEAKTAKEQNKELNKEVLLKKGEVIRLTEDLNHLQGIKTKLKNEVEELRANSVEKETRIAHLEGQISKFNSSLEKAHKEAVAAFKKSDEYKNRLDNHYAAGYEDFRADAKEAYLDLNFDSLKFLSPQKVPCFRRVLRTSTWWMMLLMKSLRMPMLPVGTSQSRAVYLSKNPFYFSLLEMLVFWALLLFFLKFIKVQFSHPSLWTIIYTITFIDFT